MKIFRKLWFGSIALLAIFAVGYVQRNQLGVAEAIIGIAATMLAMSIWAEYRSER